MTMNVQRRQSDRPAKTDSSPTLLHTYIVLIVSEQFYSVTVLLPCSPLTLFLPLTFMAPKRKRRASPLPKVLAAGEHLQRNKLSGNESPSWGWVGTDVLDVSQITKEHRMATCGLSRRSRNSFCANKYALLDRRSTSTSHSKTNGGLDDDIIVISDDEPPPCSKKLCKNNPNCLNYLGQEKWEDEGEDFWIDILDEEPESY